MIEIDRAAPRHLRSILRIEQASFGADAYSRELFEELLADCGELFLLARRSGRILGYMVTCVARGRAELISIAVEPGHRGAGVGRALMRRTLARLRRGRVPKIVLMVKVGNQPAISFYRGFGFTRVRRVPRYYEDGSDAWVMRRDL